MTVNKNELLHALEVTKGGLAAKAIIEQSTCFVFTGGKVITFNDEISISHPIEVGFVGAVNALELLAFVNKVKGDSFEITAQENELLLKSGRSKAGLIFQSEITLPVEEVAEIENWKALPKDFTKALNFTMGACSNDMTRPILTCVHINQAVIEGSDSYRIAHWDLSKKLPTKPFLLPATTCTKLVRMKLTHVSLTEGWAHFKTEENSVISCRIMFESFPDTSSWLQVKGKALTFPKNILEILDRASIFSKRDFALDETVMLKITNKKILIRSESESGWFEETTKIEFDGPDLDFSITPYLLRDILNQSSTAEIDGTKLLFKGENWKYLTTLK